jgi:peptidoglycan/xylan/chitin deacetylase (PgdA/CDA1 family)
MLLRAAAARLSPAGRRASLLTLIYHRVPREPDQLLPDEPSAARFAAQMDLVGSLFNVLSMSEAAARLKAASLPARALCITFDDGYANNCAVAAPILAARGLTATFFVATGFLDGGRMWNDTVIESVRRAPAVLDLSEIGLGVHRLEDFAARRRAFDTLVGQLKYLDPAERLAKTQLIVERAGQPLPTDLMMSQAQVRELVALGMEVGAHSVNHPILTSVDAPVARREILDSKHRLEAILGVPVTSFAYPNGRPARDYDATHVAMVREAGFVVSASTAWGRAEADTDIFQVPRIAPWDRSARRYGLRMLYSYLQPRAQDMQV